MCSSRFHKSFMLSSNASRGRAAPLRVTFADADYRPNQDSDGDRDTGPTILFIGGAGSSRWTMMRDLDMIACDARARLVAIDNFGMGGTDRVPVEHRATSYVDLVRELLDHLRIKNVALVSHSAGAIYLLNVVLELRHILHPRHPLVFMSGTFSGARVVSLVCTMLIWCLEKSAMGTPMPFSKPVAVIRTLSSEAAACKVTLGHWPPISMISPSAAESSPPEEAKVP